MPKTVNALQRGSACLCCRKRKLKCDGTRPACQQCTKMNRQDECDYDNKKQKSRTQKLKEKLQILEERVRELESDPSGSASSSTYSGTILPLTHSSAFVEASASSLDFTFLEISSPPDNSFLGNIGDLTSTYFPFSSPTWPNTTLSSSSSPLFRPGGTPAVGTIDLSAPNINTGDVDLEQFLPNHFVISPPFTLSGPSFRRMPYWDTNGPLPYENKKILMEIFLSHRRQCWFDGHIGRFEILPTPNSICEPHPALMNAIYLLACHFAHSPSFSELEPIFLARALHEITVALDKSDGLVDVVQASCLLAVYLYINCRTIEGYCHSFAAARLALGLGLHQIRVAGCAIYSADEQSQIGSSEKLTPVPIAAPRDHMELEDRISAFWQVFMVDRCWSVANGLPVALPDGNSPQVRIKTPWPNATLDPDIGDRGDVSTISTFFEHRSPSLEPLSTFLPALRAKAVALYERTYHLATVAHKSDTFWTAYHSAELAVHSFYISLPSFIGQEAWRSQPPLIDVELFAVHTMVHVSYIHLQQDPFQHETMQAANSISSLIRHLNPTDYEYLDPILSACWSCVAKVYIQMLETAVKNTTNEETTTAYTMTVIEQELEVIISAMRSLSIIFPLAGHHAQKVEQERVQARGAIV